MIRFIIDVAVGASTIVVCTLVVRKLWDAGLLHVVTLGFIGIMAAALIGGFIRACVVGED